MKFSIRFLVSALLATVHPASAATLSTLSMAGAGFVLVTWNTWKSQSFSLSAPAVSSEVVSLTLRLEVIVPNANFVVRIVGSRATPGRPDMSDVRAELRPSSMPSGTAVQTVSFARDPGLIFPPLEADTTYWLIAGMTDQDYDQPTPSGLVRWHYAGAPGQAPGAESGWAVGTAVASSGTAGENWVPVIQTPFLFSMTAMPVPEPVTSAMLVSAALLVFHRRRV